MRHDKSRGADSARPPRVDARISGLDKRDRRDGRGTDSFFGLREGEQLVFVGSLNCLRHKPYMQIAERMAAGTAALLCPAMAEFSTGRYLNLLRDAVLELAEERGAHSFVVAYGCQWVILSTDADLLAEELKHDHGIDLRFFDDSHIDEDAHH